MIKRLFLAVVLLLAVSAAAADDVQKDMLLTSDGTLYAVESVRDADSNSYYLALTTQHGESRVTKPVPATLAGGAHGNPTLSYDSESDTLFLFWQQTENGILSSRLLFASYQNGRWSEASSLDPVNYDVRQNLKIAITRYVQTGDAQGRQIQVPALTVHAVWWQDGGTGEFARYAMISIDHGAVTDIKVRSLVEFIGLPISRNEGREGVDELLRHPSIAATSTRDAVDILFGHVETNSLRRVRVKPVSDGRLRIPIGVRDENLQRPDMPFTADSKVDAVMEEDRVAFYLTTSKKMTFSLYRQGGWTAAKSVTLGGSVNAEAAVTALRKMVSDQ